VTESGDSGA